MTEQSLKERITVSRQQVYLLFLHWIDESSDPLPDGYTDRTIYANALATTFFDYAEELEKLMDDDEELEEDPYLKEEV